MRRAKTKILVQDGVVIDLLKSCRQFEVGQEIEDELNVPEIYTYGNLAKTLEDLRMMSIVLKVTDKLKLNRTVLADLSEIPTLISVNGLEANFVTIREGNFKISKLQVIRETEDDEPIELEIKMTFVKEEEEEKVEEINDEG